MIKSITEASNPLKVKTDNKVHSAVPEETESTMTHEEIEGWAKQYNI